MNVKKSILKSEQINNYILSQIKSGVLTYNSIVPSIKQVSKELGVANETVVKAYKKLKEQGILYSVHGKGFFVAKVDIKEQHRIFILFDTFAAYKETLYNAILHQFGECASLDIYFHHYNHKLFETLIKESAGKYTEYIILSHLDQDITPVLNLLPSNKVFILDGFVANYPTRGIYQDFENDTYNALVSTGKSVLRYRNFYFIYKKENIQRYWRKSKAVLLNFARRQKLKI
ncbi:MAG: GntR family transcriptional regulator [Bacteroidetes bacterium]|nr:GntR family transcriptional regulator [Bacteroidota bacterium]